MTPLKTGPSLTPPHLHQDRQGVSPSDHPLFRPHFTRPPRDRARFELTPPGRIPARPSKEGVPGLEDEGLREEGGAPPLS